ncbi:hypothetical protein [Microtetraspora malaysiensis]|uniref:hypothetical protein n=1 Tax=Microtetraspora malaysiensis TaxID=161358 RepID=UPI003D8EEB7F
MRHSAMVSVLAAGVALTGVATANTAAASSPTAGAITAAPPIQAAQSTAIEAAHGKEAAAGSLTAAKARRLAAGCLTMYRPEVRPGKIAATVWAPSCSGTLFGTNLLRKRAWGWE